MASVNNHKIKTSKEAFMKAVHSYKKQTPDRTIGMEMERFVLKTDGTIPTQETHDRFYLALRQALSDKVSVEPGTYMIEIKTGVHQTAQGMIDDMNASLDILKQTAIAHGLTVLSSSDIPDIHPDILRRHLISEMDPETNRKRRVTEIVGAYIAHDRVDLARYGCATISVQVTHSIEDATTLMRWMRVHAALAPVYMAVTENRTRQNQIVHQGLALRQSINDGGMIPAFAFEASNDNDFIKRFADFLWNNKLLTMLDDKGQDQAMSSPASFGEFPDDRKTLGNLLHAASFYWKPLKINMMMDETALQQGEIELSHLLLEVRDMDSSDNTIDAMARWFCAVTQSPETLTEVEIRLEQMGIPLCSNPMRALEMTERTLKELEKNPAYLQTGFGDSARGLTLRDAVAEIILPMMVQSKDHAGLGIWQKIAHAKEPVFKTNAVIQNRNNAKIAIE